MSAMEMMLKSVGLNPDVIKKQAEDMGAMVLDMHQRIKTIEEKQNMLLNILTMEKMCGNFTKESPAYSSIPQLNKEGIPL